MDEQIVDRLFENFRQHAGYTLTVDLEGRAITDDHGLELEFEVDDFRRHCLLNGLDDIGLTLQHADQIKAFEQDYYQRSPWLQ